MKGAAMTPQEKFDKAMAELQALRSEGYEVSGLDRVFLSQTGAARPTPVGPTKKATPDSPAPTRRVTINDEGKA